MTYVTFQRGSLIKRNDKNGFTWILRFYDAEGKRKAMILGTNEELPDRTAAKRKAASMSAIINESKKVYTVAQLIERFKKEQLPPRKASASSYRSCLVHIEAAFGEMPLDKLLSDSLKIEDWISDLSFPPTKDNPNLVAYSRKYKLNIKAVLHRLIECAMKWGYIPREENAIKFVDIKRRGIKPKSKRKKKPLTAKQIKDLLEYKELSQHVRVMVILSVFLGLRISEVLALRWENIDLEGVGEHGPCIHVALSVVGNDLNDTKTIDSDAFLPLHAFEVDTLSEWKKSPLSHSKHGWVFESEATGRPFHRDSLQADHLAPAGRAVGIEGLGWHTFRHTQIHRLRKNKTPREVQMMLARHANTSTTDEYGRDDESMDIKRPAHEAVVEMLLEEITRPEEE